MANGKKVFLILIILILGCEHKKFKNPSDPNNYPPPPILISPTNDTLLPENPPEKFHWQIKEDSNNILAGEPLESKLEFSTTENFSTTESILTYWADWNPYSRFFGDSTYYWRVASRYKGGCWGEPSEIYSFQVKFPIIYDGNFWGKDLAIEDNYLFFADDSGFIRIFDMTNPTLPSYIKKFAPDNFYATYLFKKDRYLYTIALSSPGKFSIIDIQDPLNPILLADLHLPHPKKIWVARDRAYITTNQGISVFDVTNPETTYVIDSINLSIGIRDFMVNDDYVYLLDDNQFYIFDLNSDTIISTLEIYDYDGKQFLLDGNYVYIIGQKLNIIDVSNPYQPAIVSTSYISGDKIYKNEDIIFIISYYEIKLKIFELTNIIDLDLLGGLRYSFDDLVSINDAFITIKPLKVFKLW